MLKQRVITAVILLLILLPALFYPSPAPFAFVAMVLIALAGWEWARLNGLTGFAAQATGAICLALCLMAWVGGMLARPFPYSGVWLYAGGFWVFAGAWLLKQGVPRWAHISVLLRLPFGVLMLVLAWIAVCQARVVGINFLLSILLMVWVADIFAYFTGRSFGGRFTKTKLALSISPGKSWEGVWGGMAGVLLMSFIWRWSDAAWATGEPSFYSHLAVRGWWFLAIAVLFLAAMSVVGDLVESLVKRSAGFKDSSGLLPGHGGVLDRLDALLPTLPLAMMLYSI